MEHPTISNHEALVLHIQKLRAEKLVQEENLKFAFKELAVTLNPISVIKESLHDLAKNKEVRLDFVKAGANLAITLLLNQVLKKSVGLKGSIGYTLLKMIPPSIIQNSFTKLRDRFSPKINQLHAVEDDIAI